MIQAINSFCYLDLESHTITVQFERCTFTMMVEEFLEFYRCIEEAKDFLSKSESYVVGQEYDTAGEAQKDIIIPKPDEEDYT